jgi:hypothetical protein
MIGISIHSPSPGDVQTYQDFEGAIYCTFQIIVPSGDSATLFIQNADDARELSKQFDAIADILSGLTQ